MHDPSVPSMLELVRLSRREIFPPGGLDLYRHIALLTSMSAGDEVLDVASGVGTPLVHWVREHGIQGAGVEADPASVELAEARAREEGLADRLQFQEGSPADLPYRDEVFDVVVGEIGLTAHAEPGRAIHELVRVAKPGGSVVLVQLVWKAPVDPRRRAVLSSHLGARPLMLVELKRILREEGVRDLHTEDWSDEETAFRGQVTKPFPDFTELFSLPEKIGILRRAWRRWGWKGVKAALLREREVHRLLTRERIIALDLVLGTRGGEKAATAASSGGRKRRSEGERAPLPDKPSEADGERTDQELASGGEKGEDRARRGGGSDGADGEPEPVDEHEDTVGLPLFGGDGEGS